MMKKRVIALAAVATMLLSTVSVSAAQVTGQATLTSEQGTTTVTGDGSFVDYDKTPKYQVTLPTSNAFDFTVDPNGLLDLKDGENQAAETRTGTAAVIVASNAAAVIKNESNVAVIVDAKFTVSNTGKAKLATNTAALTDANGVATEAGIYLEVVPASVKTDSVTNSALATDHALALTGNNQMSFKLNAANYVVEKTASGYTVRLATDAGNYDATVLKLQGESNKADWTEYTTNNGATPAALGITAVFSYKPCTTNVELVSGAYGLVSGQAVATTPVAGDFYASAGNVTYVGPNDVFTSGVTKVTVNGTEVLYDTSRIAGYVYIDSGVTSVDDEVLVYVGDAVYKATLTTK